YVNLGVAVGTEKGLVVPVVKHADAMDFADIEREIGRLAGLARDGKLSLDDLQGGTFTISNGGVYGSLMSTPILTPPQVAILDGQFGRKVAGVEKDPPLGGTGLNVGCIPSKALLDSSEIYQQALTHMAAHGVRAEGVTLDLPAMMGRKEKVVRGLTQGIAG